MELPCLIDREAAASPIRSARAAIGLIVVHGGEKYGGVGGGERGSCGGEVPSRSHLYTDEGIGERWRGAPGDGELTDGRAGGSARGLALGLAVRSPGADACTTQWGHWPPLKKFNSLCICTYFAKIIFRFCNFIEGLPQSIVSASAPGVPVPSRRCRLHDSRLPLSVGKVAPFTRTYRPCAQRH